MLCELCHTPSITQMIHARSIGKARQAGNVSNCTQAAASRTQCARPAPGNPADRDSTGCSHVAIKQASQMQGYVHLLQSDAQRAAARHGTCGTSKVDNTTKARDKFVCLKGHTKLQHTMWTTCEPSSSKHIASACVRTCAQPQKTAHAGEHGTQ